jgi:anti-sigma factor RsiW
MLDVMAYADGELSGADAARVEALLEKNDEARELALSMSAIGDVVRDHEAKREIDIADQVMSRVDKSSTTPPTDIERARLKRASRVRIGVAIATITALAAGVFIYKRSTEDDSAKSRPIMKAPTAVVQNTTPPTTGVSVEKVDTNQSVSVFYVDDETNKAPPTTVVWIDDQPTE